MSKEMKLKMTPEKIRDLGLAYFEAYGADKYNRGQDEHGGLLTDRDLLDDMMDEAIDMFWYAWAAKLRRIITMAEFGCLSPKQLYEELEKLGIRADDIGWLK